MIKSLKEISWQVSEEEYRQDPALSYSLLAKYEREGFNSLPHLFDKISTPSLTFGSAVDSLITGGKAEFEDRFIVAEFPPISDSIIVIVKDLFNVYNKSYITINEIPDNIIIECAAKYAFQPNYRPETRAKIIKEKGVDYYNLLYISEGKTLLSMKVYNDVIECVKVLKHSDNTKYYFNENPFEPEIERLYQLKFKATFQNIDYRCMMDLVIVDHINKCIIPIDLKTSSKPEWDFYKSFIEWKYMIQARLYYRILKENLAKDPYFRDFTVTDYKFIDISKFTKVPLVWVFEDTPVLGTLCYQNNNYKIECRDPFKIGDELTYYLNEKPNIPIGISTTSDNSLKIWLNK